MGTTRLDPSIHDMSRVRLGQMLIIDALQNALAIRLGAEAPSDSMLRTVTQYTYQRPRSPGRHPRKVEGPADAELRGRPD